MDLTEHISKYLIGNSSRYFERDLFGDFRRLVEFFRDVPISFAEPSEGEELDEDQELANDYLEKIGFGEFFLTAIDDVPDYNLVLMESMTEEQSDVLGASRTARLVIELGPDDERPRLDLILKPEVDEFHTVWGAYEEGNELKHDASWLGLYYELDGEDRYLEIHFCPWLP